MSEHNTDRAQIAALGAANIGNPITGEMVSRQAAMAARIEAQVDATRSAVAQLGLNKFDLLTIDFLTSHFLTMAAELRAESQPCVSDPAQSETQAAPIIAGETQGLLAAPDLSCLQCYRPTIEYGCDCCGGDMPHMEPDEDGEYVRFEAVEALLDAPAAQPADHIAAATEMVAPAVKVKALEWEGFISGNYRIDIEKGGIARLFYYSAAIYEDECPEEILGGYLTLVSMDDLKAAAQADYEARILAALEGGDA